LIVKCSVFAAALVVFTLATCWQASATHLRAADIRIEPICGSPRTYRITIIAYLNTLSNTRFGTSSEIHFGDGQFIRIPVSAATPRPDLGNNIAVATYVTTHTYQLTGSYLVTYLERDRSTGVLNIENSRDVPYVTNVTIDISDKYGCNNYPVLAVPPIDRACHKSTFYHTSGAYDVDGDSLSYDLTIPLASQNNQANYTSPTHDKYYTDPARGNEAKTGRATFTIDKLTGLLTLDAPGMIGEYNIAFRVHEWRKDEATGKYDRISTTTRDMQIIVEECVNIRPELIVSADTCIVAGSAVEVTATGIDADRHQMKIEVYSEIIDMPASNNPADYSPRPAVFLPADPKPTSTLTWATTCAHVRQQPYQVVFKITDNPPNGPKLVNFKVWNVRVIGPPPQQDPAQLDLVRRQAVLNWSSYECANAKAIQVWRKVGSHPGAAGYCDTRSPGLWGYKLIKELPPAAITFTDDNFGKGLSVGAMYCYRIVGAIADTRSFPSEEFCVGPIQADAPVITHVSVVETSSSGSMQVSWRKPFNINKTQFPEPYQYEVYRADDFIGDAGIKKAGRVTDTTFRDIGIDTKEKVYNYRIVLYAKPQSAQEVVPIDTSAVSSSVWLMAKPGEKEIELTWRDSAAWSNVVATHPWHRIYRSTDNSDPAAMVLIDSVDVTFEGFKYVDRGSYKNAPIEEDKYYFYRVMTRGTYGNPRIKTLENFSQTVSTYPINDLLPCAPLLTIAIQDCEEYVLSENCDEPSYSNRIDWSTLDLKGCRRDIISYNVYASSRRDGPYELIANVADTFYVDKGLKSFARCYRVASMDKLGIEGPKSDSACNNNCPFYLLPNVFSPNGDGYNDAFHARFKAESDAGATTCPRFVQVVELTILNRWGKQVYRRRSEGADEVIALEWDGRDESGNEMPPGVYYYSADVTFGMLDDENRQQNYKGWVQLIR
jgi:gliding motility-associated-like protein